MKRLCDLNDHQIQVGLKYKGLKSGRTMIIVEIDYNDDNYCWTRYEDESEDAVRGGFYLHDHIVMLNEIVE